MVMPGLGVMINELCGNAESVQVFTAALGKVITALTHDDSALHFVFEDGSKMRVFDDGQSCCESRYMRTDDNLADFVGAKLISAELRSAPVVEGEYGEAHEVQFLVVKTDKGQFTMSNHNEHNGYYGGFSIRAETET